jgi:hypothetical protein
MQTMQTVAQEYHHADTHMCMQGEATCPLPSPPQGPAVRASSRRKAPEASKAAKQLEDLKDLRERRAARSRAKAPAARKGKRRDESEEEESEQEEGAVSSEDEVGGRGLCGMWCVV